MTATSSHNLANNMTVYEPPLELERALRYPQIRFMGSKHRLLPWIHEVFSSIEFHTALDAFSGSGCVSYLLKCMGKSVVSTDFLNFTHHFANALIANPGISLTEDDVRSLVQTNGYGVGFCEETFADIFFNQVDLRFFDTVRRNADHLTSPWKKSLTIAALCRAAVKKQPRGVFTVSNAIMKKYDDGRRDLKLSIEEHFRETINIFNSIVFSDGKDHMAHCCDVFEAPTDVDLVYLDPPYVPRSDDNCYIKRYHFIEGLAAYWQDMEIMLNTRVRKIRKRFTPFSYRRTAIDAFGRLFSRFQNSILVLSYSSNGYPDLDQLVTIMRRHKQRVDVYAHDHRYHFGTHDGVDPDRAAVTEYLIVGT